jgi:tetratricopeptide (TPR) repeat protein
MKRAVQDIDPSLIIAYINKIDAYLLLGDEKKVIETLKEAENIDIIGLRSVIYNILPGIRQFPNDKRRIEFYGIELKKLNKLKDFTRNLLDRYWRKGQKIQAYNLGEELLRNDPNSISIWLNIIKMLLADERYEEAIEHGERAEKIFSTNQLFYHILVRHYTI